LKFENKLPKETWRGQDDGSVKLTETYRYSNKGLLEEEISTTYGYEEKTRYFYKDKTAIKSEKISEGVKLVSEWSQDNDSTFSQVEFSMKDGHKNYKRATRFIVDKNKTTEIRYDFRTKQSDNIFSTANESFRNVSLVNKKEQVIWEEITYGRSDLGTTTHTYKYNNAGNMTYHEQHRVEKKEKTIWETVYNQKGKSVRSTGKHYEDGKLQFTTLNVYTYDEFGNLTSEDQTGSLYLFKYTYDRYNNWIRKETYAGKELFEIDLRQIKYFSN
jgi:hypothetical protein